MLRPLKTLFCIGLAACLCGQTAALAEREDTIGKGIAWRDAGELKRAIGVLDAARKTAPDAEAKALASGELGITLLQARQYEAAEAPLREAHDYFIGVRLGRYAAYLGNLAMLRKHPAIARQHYEEALAEAGENADTRLSVELNLARMLPPGQRLAKLEELSQLLDRQETPTDYIRQHLSLGNLAHQAAGLRLAYRHLERARQLAATTGEKRLYLEAVDALAQLYEEQGLPADALRLNRLGIDASDPLPAAQNADLLINFHWRAGRLLKAAGQLAPAEAAYLRAVEQIELIRQDIPVEYEDGRSSFRATLEPIYLGYADLVLRQIDRQYPAARAAGLRSVINTLELIRQTELQDFLGDRCAVETVQGGSGGQIAPKTAVLYPLILPDRLELLLQTPAGIVRRTSPVDASTLRATARHLAGSLRGGLDDYLAPSRRLYDWLLRPFEEQLASESIRSLIVVPDGALRLVPVGALWDGQHYAIERLSVSMVTGMSMTNSAPAPGGKVVSLVAGVSQPGSVVEKLSGLMAAQILEPGTMPESSARSVIRSADLRAIRAPAAARPERSAGELREIEELKVRLALPGVEEEIKALALILPGSHLLNDKFTIDRFRHETESGTYRIVHIASHGVFGGSAESSFIMAHDDVLTMNGLQSLLRAERFQKAPIELLSLSACQTAEGNDRSPLGISGAAIKARAKSVLGTLWPVEDNAARAIMTALYSGLTTGQLSKTEALRQGQLALLRQPESAHPFFWAPFVLIGNWQR